MRCWCSAAGCRAICAIAPCCRRSPRRRALVDVDGHIAPPPSRLYEFAPSTSGPIRQNLDLGEFATETGLPLLPLSVLQSDSAGTRATACCANGRAPAVDVQKHYGYAFQWFALCALMAGLYVWFQLVRPRWKRTMPGA